MLLIDSTDISYLFSKVSMYSFFLRLLSWAEICWNKKNLVFQKEIVLCLLFGPKYSLGFRNVAKQTKQNRPIQMVTTNLKSWIFWWSLHTHWVWRWLSHRIVETPVNHSVAKHYSHPEDHNNHFIYHRLTLFLILRLTFFNDLSSS